MLAVVLLALAQAPGEPGGPGLAVHVAKAVLVSSAPVDNATILVRDGRIEAVGPRRATPEGYVAWDMGPAWAVPGMVDLHSHIQTGGWGDINDSVHPDNPELRVLDTVWPRNDNIKGAIAGGVTSILGIPGSGSNIGGFGAILSLGPATVEEMQYRPLGAMKVAQGYNPERRGGDLGASRMGMSWMLHRFLSDARDYAAAVESDPATPARRDLDHLAALFRRECPVLIHTAGGRDVRSTARMFFEAYGLWTIVSHGTFNGYHAAPALAELGVPVNLGPRNFDLNFNRNGQVLGIAASYAAAGVEDISINTDANVIPPEELSLQAAMNSRWGFDDEDALRALTLSPALQIGIGDRVGSLEPGKDADVVFHSGPPVDPRSRVDKALIRGVLVYDRIRDGQRY